jgi:hypothetical protein
MVHNYWKFFGTLYFARRFQRKQVVPPLVQVEVEKEALAEREYPE